MRESQREEVSLYSLDLKEVTVSLSRAVFGSEFQMAGAVQRNACNASVVVFEKLSGQKRIDQENEEGKHKFLDIFDIFVK